MAKHSTDKVGTQILSTFAIMIVIVIMSAIAFFKMANLITFDIYKNQDGLLDHNSLNFYLQTFSRSEMTHFSAFLIVFNIFIESQLNVSLNSLFHQC